MLPGLPLLCKLLCLLLIKLGICGGQPVDECTGWTLSTSTVSLQPQSAPDYRLQFVVRSELQSVTSKPRTRTLGHQPWSLSISRFRAKLQMGVLLDGTWGYFWTRMGEFFLSHPCALDQHEEFYSVICFGSFLLFRNADSACSHWLSKRPDFNFVFGRCVCQLADKLGQLFQLLWRWGIWMNDWMSPWSVAVVESSGVPTFHRMPWLPCCQEPAPPISGASHPNNVLLCLFSYLSQVWWQIAFRKGHRFKHFWVLPAKEREGRREDCDFPDILDGFC